MRTNSPVMTRSTNGEYWLDTRDTYHLLTWNKGAAENLVAGSNDSPPITLDDAIHVQASSAFKLFGMFRPAVADPTIWVPVGLYTWGWDGSSDLQNGQWNTMGKGNPSKEPSRINLYIIVWT